MELTYFKMSDFDSPDYPGSGEMGMDESFLTTLEACRELADIPFFVNSGFRTAAHNEKVGGSPTSSHLFGFAVDISCTDSASRQKIIDSAVKSGFKRIGIAKTFIHLDTDPEKNPAIWLY